MTLPKRYVEDVREAPAREGGHLGQLVRRQGPEARPRVLRDPRRRRRRRYFDVYDEMKVPPDQLETWKHDKQGAIVGDVLAKKLGWKVGDKVILQSGIYPGDWQFNVDGIYKATAQVGRPLDVRLPLGLPERLAARRAAGPGRLDRQPRRRPGARRRHRRRASTSSSRTATRRRCRRTSAASTRRSWRCSRRSSRR